MEGKQRHGTLRIIIVPKEGVIRIAGLPYAIGPAPPEEYLILEIRSFKELSR